MVSAGGLNVTVFPTASSAAIPKCCRSFARVASNCALPNHCWSGYWIVANRRAGQSAG